jgi:hypothetical protein
MATIAMVVAAGCSGDTGSPPDLGKPIPAESPTSEDDTSPTQSPTGEGDSSTGEAEATAQEASHESEPLGAPIAMEFAGERSPVVSVGADEAAALQIPGDLDTVGWWKGGAEPGAAEGFVVITGHATQDGRAAANAWWDAEPGDRVVIETESGTATYRVISRQTYSYEDIPLARWFPAGGPNGPAGLALITCADYRDGEWHSNLVVEAVPE